MFKTGNSCSDGNPIPVNRFPLQQRWKRRCTSGSTPASAKKFKTD
jgi:hypothetical protein